MLNIRTGNFSLKGIFIFIEKKLKKIYVTHARIFSFDFFLILFSMLLLDIQNVPLPRLLLLTVLTRVIALVFYLSSYTLLMH